MKYKLYTTSQQAWDAMFQAIDLAERSIYLEMYILSMDTIRSHDFVGELRKKARQGVRVTIVADAYGSRELRRASKNWNEPNLEIIFFSHWLRHTHRKILVIDERLAFIGGVNISERFRYWNDLVLGLSGRTVKRILRSFAYTYAMAGGQDRKILNYRKKKFVSKLRFWLLEHYPIKNIYALKSHYAEKITGAKESVRIVTPYFTPPRWLISLLDDAVRRQVEVEVLIPRKSNMALINRINYRFIHILYASGIKFYLTRGMNHSKLLLIDGEEALVGSQNIDPLSFRINHEVGIFTREKKLVEELENIIKFWKKDAQIFEPKKYRMKLIDYLLYVLVKIFLPIL